MNSPARRLAAMLLTMAGMAIGSAFAAMGSASFDGDWLAPAEDANDVDAEIHLAAQPNAQWAGTIKRILATRPDQRYRNDTVCAACPGALRGSPLQGLGIIWGMQARDGGLSGGHILDPDDGQVYDCDMTMSADGKTITVLAYKRLKWLGHTMTWRRE